MTQHTDRTIATSKRRYNALGNAASCRRFEPRAALEACVRGFVVRRVKGTADSEHLSRFPATASCGLSWFLEGSAVRVCDEQSTHARIVFRGPQTRPVVVRHRGPLHMFILLLAPDALWWLTGAGVDRHLNRIYPLAAALDDSWQAMALGVLHAPTDEDRVNRIEKFLEPRWHAARSRNRAASWGPAQRYGEWSRAAISRAHIFSKGRSRRQLERQMRTMTGWSARALRGLARAEDALLLAARSTQPRVNWASIAAEAGYADQSHLCRELRRYTGFSPQQLWRCVPNEEDLWVYKAWFGWSGARDNILQPSDAHS
jgi:AraC-like DNA-binding protein